MFFEPFEGFTLAAFCFFEELERNNNREWFEANKLIYESEALRPVRNLAGAMAHYFHFKDYEMELSVRRIVSRITRDTRTCPTQPPFKTHLQLHFQRAVSGNARNWSSYPGFFISIGKTGADYGIHVRNVRQKTMEGIRKAILDEPEDFLLTIKGLPKHGYELTGTPCKHPIEIEEDSAESLTPWIQQENLCVAKHLGISYMILSEDLIPYMQKEFERLQPLYKFLIDACV